MSKVIQLKVDKFKKYGSSRQELKKALVPLVQWMSDYGAESVHVELPSGQDGLANTVITVRMVKS